MSGLVFAQSGAKTSLDVPALARVACAGRGSLQQRADTFLSIAHDSVARVVQSLRARDPAVFRQITHGDVFDVFFAGASDGRQCFFRVAFAPMRMAPFRPRRMKAKLTMVCGQ